MKRKRKKNTSCQISTRHFLNNLFTFFIFFILFYWIEVNTTMHIYHFFFLRGYCVMANVRSNFRTNKLFILRSLLASTSPAHWQCRTNRSFWPCFSILRALIKSTFFLFLSYLRIACMFFYLPSKLFMKSM